MRETSAYLVEHAYPSIDSMVAAIGNRRNIDFMATINGQRDRQQRYAHNASHLKALLESRGFDPSRGDTVSVWLPQQMGADMLGTS